MKVSYLIPLYNKENFIVECIESILRENSIEIEIEVCIVDDGSTDSSLFLVKQHYRNNINIKIAEFKVNKGKNSAFNRAFEMASGDFVCLFGADDVVIPGRTKVLLDAAIKCNKAVYGGLIAKDEKMKKELFRNLPTKPDLYSISLSNSLSGGCILLATSLYSEIFPIPEHLKFEDWWIAYYLVKNNKVIVLNEYVTYYRIGSNNDCAFSSDKIFEGIKRDYSRHIDCLFEMDKFSPNPYIKKSIDLRNALLGYKIDRLIYLKPFDIFSFKIIFFKIFGARFFYKALNTIRKIKGKKA